MLNLFKIISLALLTILGGLDSSHSAAAGGEEATTHVTVIQAKRQISRKIVAALNDTVHDLKVKIEEVFGIPVDKQRLISYPHELRDEQILGEFYDPTNIRIHLIELKESRKEDQRKNEERERAAREARIRELESLIAPLEAERARIESKLRPLEEELFRLRS